MQNQKFTGQEARNEMHRRLEEMGIFKGADDFYIGAIDGTAWQGWNLSRDLDSHELRIQAGVTRAAEYAATFPSK